MNQPKTFSSSPLLLPLPYTAPCLPSQKPWFSAHCRIACSTDRYQSRHSVTLFPRPPSPLYRTRSSICQDLEQYPHLVSPSKIVSFSTEGHVSIAHEELFHSQRQSLSCSIIILFREGDGLLTFLLLHYVAVSNQFPVVDTSFVIREKNRFRIYCDKRHTYTDIFK